VADISQPEVRAQLDGKHPQRERQVPGELRHIGGGQGPFPRVTVPLEARYRGLRRLAGTGPDGFRNEYLTPLTTVFDDAVAKRALSTHELMAEWYANGEMPPWAYALLSEAQMVALVKKHNEGGPPDVRPIAIVGCRQRAWEAEMTAVTAAEAAEEFLPSQLAIGTSNGLELLYLAITAHLEHHPDHVLLSLDARNAFNSPHRLDVVMAMLSMQACRRLATVFHATHAPKSKIRGIRRRSERGVRQGSPLGPLAFCCAIHEDVKWAAAQMEEADGACFFYMDDGYLLGPVEVVSRVARELKARLEVKGIQSHPEKNLAFAPSADGRQRLTQYLAEHQDAGFQQGVDASGDLFGVKVAGLPVGEDAYVAAHLEGKMDTVCEAIETITNALLPWSRQALYAVLVYSVLPKVMYEMRTIPPSVMHPYLTRFDDRVLHAVAAATGITQVTAAPDSDDYDEVLMRRLRLPKRLSGAAIRSQADTADAAWVGGMMAVLSKLAPNVKYEGGVRTEVSVGVHPRLGRWLVGEALNDLARRGDVYQHFVTNQGSRLGAEFREAWNRMRAEATMEGALEPGSSLLCRPVERAGTNDAGEKMDVTRVQRELTRDIETTARDRLNAELVAQPAVAEAQDVYSFGVQRHRLVWLNLSPHSRQFVASLPTSAETAIACRHFQVMCETYLGVKATSLRDTWDKVVRAKNREVKLDEYGDRLAATAGTALFNERHNALEYLLAGHMREAHLNFRGPEVQGLFTAHIRAPPGADRPEARAGIIPDLYLEAEDGRRVLYDVKAITLSPSWYRVPRRNRDEKLWGVRRRQIAVPREYKAKAKDADRGYNRTPRNETGPVERALAEFEVQGLVAGAFGEMSGNIETLEERIVKGMAGRYKEDGSRSFQEAKAVASFRVRRSLGIAAARGLARLKVKRLDEVMGCGQQAPSEEGQRDAWEKRRQAYYERCVGLGVGRREAGWPGW